MNDSIDEKMIDLLKDIVKLIKIIEFNETIKSTKDDNPKDK
ncbi:hypothetical protein [Candidatus Phytoplasma pyri]